MSGGKNKVKNGLKNFEKLLETSCFFCMSCQNTVNTSVFGWFALKTGS